MLKDSLGARKFVIGSAGEHDKSIYGKPKFQCTLQQSKTSRFNIEPNHDTSGAHKWM